MPLRVHKGYPVTVAPSILDPIILPIFQIYQDQTQWCWAACADMVLNYYGAHNFHQCDCANWLFGLSICCDVPSSFICNQPCNIGDVCSLYDRWGLRCSYTEGSVLLATLQFELNHDRPVEIGYAWNGGGGHVILVTGWFKTSTDVVLVIKDPTTGSGTSLYKNLLTAQGKGTWQWTWTNLTN